MTDPWIDLDVHDMAHGGEGVGRYEGKAVKSSWARARLEEVVTPAPARVAPPCPHFVECGGCQ